MENCSNYNPTTVQNLRIVSPLPTLLLPPPLRASPSPPPARYFFLPTPPPATRATTIGGPSRCPSPATAVPSHYPSLARPLLPAVGCPASLRHVLRWGSLASVSSWTAAAMAGRRGAFQGWHYGGQLRHRPRPTTSQRKKMKFIIKILKQLFLINVGLTFREKH
jgi:hypothetical protein